MVRKGRTDIMNMQNLLITQMRTMADPGRANITAPCGARGIKPMTGREIAPYAVCI